MRNLLPQQELPDLNESTINLQHFYHHLIDNITNKALSTEKEIYNNLIIIKVQFHFKRKDREHRNIQRVELINIRLRLVHQLVN